MLAFIALVVISTNSSKISMACTIFSVFAVSGTITEWICQRNSKSVKKEIPPKNIMPPEKYVQPEKVAFPKLQEQTKLLIQLYRDKISFEALAEIMAIKEMVFSLLPYLEEMEISDYERHTAIKIVTDYLPKTLRAYSELPKDFAANHKSNGKTPEDILMEQLVIMKEQIQAITDTMNNEKLDDFLIQTEFLKSKFSEKL
jgi:hypothetical protein